MKKLKKKVKENWLGFILGAALTYFVSPAVGLPVLQKALQDKAVIEVPEPDKSLTDSAPRVIINPGKEEENKENEDAK